MNKQIKSTLKKNLEKRKISIEKQLKKFADKDKKLTGDWDTRFPQFNGKESGNAAMEQAADEVEAYANLLPVEHSLELRLQSINNALKKIKTEKYGFCEKCQKKIEDERIKVYPDAQYCLKCKNN